MNRIIVLFVVFFLVSNVETNAQFATAAATSPSCPFISPGYIPDGSFTVTINDIAACPMAAYDIIPTPVPGSGPLGTTPPAPIPNTFLGVAAGGADYFFVFAGAGDYTIQLNRLTGCMPPMMDTSFVVTVPDGTDNVDPIWSVRTLAAELVVDNDPFTPAPTTAVLDDVVEFEETFIMTGLDLCDGFIIPLDAVTATASPGTDVTVIPDGLGNYTIDISWGPGTPVQVVLTGSDVSGNDVDLTIFRNVAPIPTLGQWGIIALTLLLSIIGVVVLRKEEVSPA